MRFRWVQSLWPRRRWLHRPWCGPPQTANAAMACPPAVDSTERGRPRRRRRPRSVLESALAPELWRRIILDLLAGAFDVLTRAMGGAATVADRQEHRSGEQS